MTNTERCIKQIRRELTGCFKDEFRAAYLVGSDVHTAALLMAAADNPQIKAGEFEKWGYNGASYQRFAPCQDTFKYKGFRWNKIK